MGLKGFMKKRGVCGVTAALVGVSLVLTGCGEAAKPEETTPTTVVLLQTEEAVREMEAWLSDPVNNGFLGERNEYGDPQGIDWYQVFYDGAGIGRTYDELNEAQRQELTTNRHFSPDTPGYVFVKKELSAFMQAKAGLTASEAEKAISAKNFYEHTESGELYFIQHTDKSAFPVKVYEVKTLGDGDRIVTYSADETQFVRPTLRPHQVKLRPVENGYQFLSNVETADAVPTTTAAPQTDDAAAETTAAPTSVSKDISAIYGTWRVEKLLGFGLHYGNGAEYPVGPDIVGDEIVLRRDVYSTKGLDKVEKYQQEVREPVYTIAAAFADTDEFFRVYKTDLPVVKSGDTVRVIEVEGAPIGGYYLINNDTLVLDLESACFALTRVGD